MSLIVNKSLWSKRQIGGPGPTEENLREVKVLPGTMIGQAITESGMLAELPEIQWERRSRAGGNLRSLRNTLAFIARGARANGVLAW